MRQHRSIADRATRVLLLGVVLALLAAPAAAQAKAVVIIYGKGGIQVWPPSICAQQDPAKCAEVTFDSQSPSEITVVDAIGAVNYNAVLSEPIPENVISMQGSDLQVESIEPVE